MKRDFKYSKSILEILPLPLDDVMGFASIQIRIRILFALDNISWNPIELHTSAIIPSVSSNPGPSTKVIFVLLANVKMAGFFVQEIYLLNLSPILKGTKFK
jgi:hypothetical protein